MEHFNTNDEEYSVIFTANCTAALKTIAECFTFSSPPLNNIDEPNVSISQTKTSQQHGCFCYLLDNHTSVQGMRECLQDRASVILCLPESELENKDVSKSYILTHHAPYNVGNCLFVYPAQSNFSGQKYPLSWIQKIRNQEMGFQNQFGGNWFTVLDAAAFVSTAPLDLGVHKPDFVTLSFYKMFGFPTGLGINSQKYLYFCLNHQTLFRSTHWNSNLEESVNQTSRLQDYFITLSDILLQLKKYCIC